MIKIFFYSTTGTLTQPDTDKLSIDPSARINKKALSLTNKTEFANIEENEHSRISLIYASKDLLGEIVDEEIKNFPSMSQYLKEKGISIDSFCIDNFDKVHKAFRRLPVMHEKYSDVLTLTDAMFFQAISSVEKQEIPFFSPDLKVHYRLFSFADFLSRDDLKYIIAKAINFIVKPADLEEKLVRHIIQFYQDKERTGEYASIKVEVSDLKAVLSQADVSILDSPNAASLNANLKSIAVKLNDNQYSSINDMLDNCLSLMKQLSFSNESIISLQRYVLSKLKEN